MHHLPIQFRYPRTGPKPRPAIRHKLSLLPIHTHSQKERRIHRIPPRTYPDTQQILLQETVLWPRRQSHSHVPAHCEIYFPIPQTTPEEEEDPGHLGRKHARRPEEAQPLRTPGTQPPSGDAAGAAETVHKFGRATYYNEWSMSIMCLRSHYNFHYNYSWDQSLFTTAKHWTSRSREKEEPTHQVSKLKRNTLSNLIANT